MKLTAKKVPYSSIVGGGVMLQTDDGKEAFQVMVRGFPNGISKEQDADICDRIIGAFNETAALSTRPAAVEVTPEQLQAFHAALDAPPKENPALKKLLQGPSVFDRPAAVDVEGLALKVVRAVWEEEEGSENDIGWTEEYKQKVIIAPTVKRVEELICQALAAQQGE